jgi:glycosyltransferase involved in cell wall biosynthesis
MNSQKDIVMLSTAEWDNPFWTNKQHVAVALAKMGYRVLYIDSLGLRRPSASSQDLIRILKRLKKALKAPFEVKKNIWVWSPIILPFQSVPWVRRLNKMLLSGWLYVWQKKLKFKNDIFWTYNPITTNILNLSRFKKIIYHCVDEIKEQPGMPVDSLENGERELARLSNYIFATSKKLYETRKNWNENTYYFSNVADFDHFQKAQHESTQLPRDIQDIPTPRIGFIGAISGYKVDFALIDYLARSNPSYSFVLIGKVGEGDPWSDISKLKQNGNIYFLGAKKYDELPGYLKAMDVAILPNMINEYTDAMFPMKFFEYLAASKPVVSVNLKSLSDFKDIAYISSDYTDFSNNLKSALNDPDYNLNERLSVASQFTYDSRMIKMMNIIEG